MYSCTYSARYQAYLPKDALIDDARISIQIIYIYKYACVNVCTCIYIYTWLGVRLNCGNIPLQIGHKYTDAYTFTINTYIYIYVYGYV